MKCLVNTLSEDVAAAQADLASEDTQYRRRTLVRTTFAAIEGWSHALKQLALAAAEHKPDPFSPAERVLLRAESFELTADACP